MPKTSPAEPVTALRSVPITEIHEPLVDYRDLHPKIVVARARFHYRRETMLRQGVAERLARAADRLPGDIAFAVVEGWRAPHIQRRMYRAAWNRFAADHPDWSHSRLVRTVNRYTAPMNVKVPPPHTTGGAIDLVLLGSDGNELPMSLPFEMYDPKSFSTDAAGLDESSRRNRYLLCETLAAEGITNYPSEFWHYSFGDQGWAYRGGEPSALYGPITPTNWTPDPQDDIDEPLVFVEDDHVQSDP